MQLERDEDELALGEGIERMVSGCAEASCTTEDRAAMLWRTMIADGWVGLALPEHRGGVGGSLDLLCTMMEQCGRHALVTPFFSSIMLGARLLAETDAAGKWNDLLGETAAGDRLLAFAHEELATAYGEARATIAQRAGDGWRITGHKIAVLGAGAASHLLVSASAEGGAALFLLDRNDPGLTLRPYPTLRGEDAADIAIDATVPDEALLALDAGEAIDRLTDAALVALCSEAVGAMRWLIDATADYAAIRKQFGRPLAEFQVIQHRLAEMAVQLEDARAATQLAIVTAGDPDRCGRAASTAKLVTGSAAAFVGEQAIQLHGAMGVTEELPVGRYVRLLTAFDYLLGDSDAHIARYARTVIGPGLQRFSVILGAAA
ncbi:MAG: pimeloyl-CoA dehydrogenase small subunit [Sphingomonas bacterium]|uniref:acyl-CoA dehydrogenase family protein n=1 Tax=Sphingomonas bacterium TaxID=1895847 RepID=UPI002622F7A2|nr:acyl-CoA dehydrogenase [Sphingomonas bacterium]MDB5703868.1 pimeloyl-CoA dehydrogenase small subunit [Sphingomonas bacterium]